MKSFRENLLLLTEAAVGHWDASSGVPEQSVREAEKRIGFRLPEELRVFYLMVGELPAVMNSHDNFVKIDDLRLENDGLAFLSENQNQCFWAVQVNNITDADPPVVQGQPGERTWYDECPKLSVFLLNYSCWQLINSLPGSGWCPLDKTTIKTVRQYHAPISATLQYNMATFVDSEHGIIVNIWLDAEKLYVGAKSDEILEDFEERTGLELNWLD